MAEEKKRVAVVGGGISGLITAKRLMEAGYEVDLFEASERRLGGKIQSQTLSNSDIRVDGGAEFIDSTHPQMHQLCEELGIKLTPASDQNKSSFELPNGQVLTEDQFLEAYRPVAALIAEDKKILAADPTGERAQHLNSLSLPEYMKELAAAADPKPHTLLQRLKHMIGMRKHAVDPAVLETAAHSYASEAGRDPSQISALQFANEASPTPDAFLASDAGFRVEGGMESVIHALEKDLKEKGVRFHMGAKAKEVKKDGDKFELEFDKKQENAPEDFDKVVMALPMHALGEVKGLDKLGLEKEDVKLLKEGQYTHNVKFSIAINGEAPHPFFMSSDGFQTWSPQPGVVTFLVGGDKLMNMSKKEMVDHCLETYAKASGTTVDKLFDQSRMAINAPSDSNPCYASPAPQQGLEMAQLGERFAHLAEQGVGIVGTYLPCRGEDGMSIGFMECGLESIDRTVGIMTSRERALAEGRGMAQAYSGMEHGAPPVTVGEGRTV